MQPVLRAQEMIERGVLDGPEELGNPSHALKSKLRCARDLLGGLTDNAEISEAVPDMLCEGGLAGAVDAFQHDQGAWAAGHQRPPPGAPDSDPPDGVVALAVRTPLLGAARCCQAGVKDAPR